MNGETWYALRWKDCCIIIIQIVLELIDVTYVYVFIYVTYVYVLKSKSGQGRIVCYFAFWNTNCTKVKMEEKCVRFAKKTLWKNNKRGS